ncbi:hypothetical protein CXG81DRAFT_11895 [Caulochytrium protostelioides]|uniref:Hydroxysteroid dehydrogenase-like protein 2 n=1 Tax=Caulochytrium protostelioides TaxID=1555241 RepID=A0A4P9X8B7_9FUNG|nr:hypothetical protein CXG81DRAFT_11895 [Caulochytrium protostelioides]|eukprot:RKP01508.1 hypothetical protein CXG81DRAFT_11895 [Caulochytrium protostelioides]
MSLRGKTLFITGASRGIGLAIGLRAAREGANVAIAAKTTEPTPKLPGTIYTAAAEIEQAGGRALPLVCDIRSEEAVAAAIAATVARFGGIDIVVNNASAIALQNTTELPVKRYDLMHAINGRGTWLTSKLALPHLRRSAAQGRNPHILMLSPPLDLNPAWFAPHVAYSMAKYNMSIVALGLAGELADDGIAVNCLWPKTVISTAAVSNVVAGSMAAASDAARLRTPAIMADAAYTMLCQPSRGFTGQFVIDEDLLRANGVRCFKRYQHDPSVPEDQILPDFFVPEKRTPPRLPVRIDLGHAPASKL